MHNYTLIIATTICFISAQVEADDKIFTYSTNQANPYPSGSGTYGYFNSSSHWNSGIPSASDRAIFNTAGDPSLRNSVAIRNAATSNKLLINQGEVSMWLDSQYNVTSNSIDPSTPTIDISRSGATGYGATLWVWNDGGSLNSAGYTTIGNHSGSAGRLIVGKYSHPDYSPANVETNGLVVGRAGSGRLLIEKGGTLHNHLSADVGMESSAFGSVTITGTRFCLDEFR